MLCRAHIAVNDRQFDNPHAWVSAGMLLTWVTQVCFVISFDDFSVETSTNLKSGIELCSKITTLFHFVPLDYLPCGIFAFSAKGNHWQWV